MRTEVEKEAGLLLSYLHDQIDMKPGMEKNETLHRLVFERLDPYHREQVNAHVRQLHSQGRHEEARAFERWQKTGVPMESTFKQLERLRAMRYIPQFSAEPLRKVIEVPGHERIISDNHESESWQSPYSGMGVALSDKKWRQKAREHHKKTGELLPDKFREQAELIKQRAEAEVAFWQAWAEKADEIIEWRESLQKSRAKKMPGWWRQAVEAFIADKERELFTEHEPEMPDSLRDVGGFVMVPDPAAEREAERRRKEAELAAQERPRYRKPNLVK